MNRKLNSGSLTHLCHIVARLRIKVKGILFPYHGKADGKRSRREGSGKKTMSRLSVKRSHKGTYM